MTLNDEYILLDSGNGEKLEQLGAFCIRRPCLTALWAPQYPEIWHNVDACFSRDKGWVTKKNLPDNWVISSAGFKFLIKLTPFGHLGLFPEQQMQWNWIKEILKNASQDKKKVLNLFAYSGGATFASVNSFTEVTHVDASYGMIEWAKNNAQLNDMQNAPIRWIVEDATKYLHRCVKRGELFDGIILDPPSFGRGPKKEVFKIEETIFDLIELCVRLLTRNPIFLLFSCHTPAFTPISIKNILEQSLKKRFSDGKFEQGEMLLEGKEGLFSIPSGCYTRAYFN